MIPSRSLIGLDVHLLTLKVQISQASPLLQNLELRSVIDGVADGG
jgi:hypothetical protein